MGKGGLGKKNPHQARPGAWREQVLRTPRGGYSLSGHYRRSPSGPVVNKLVKEACPGANPPVEVT